MKCLAFPDPPGWNKQDSTSRATERKKKRSWEPNARECAKLNFSGQTFPAGKISLLPHDILLSTRLDCMYASHSMTGLQMLERVFFCFSAKLTANIGY